MISRGWAERVLARVAVVAAAVLLQGTTAGTPDGVPAFRTGAAEWRLLDTEGRPLAAGTPVEFSLQRHAFGIGSAEQPYPRLDRMAASLGVNLRVLDAPSEAAAWYRHLGDRVFVRAAVDGPFDAVELPVGATGSVYQVLDEFEKACREYKARNKRTAIVVNAAAGRRMGMSREAFVYALRMRRSPVDRVLVELGPGENAADELKRLGRYGFPIDVVGGWRLLPAAFATPGIESFTVRGLSEGHDSLKRLIDSWTTRGSSRADANGVVRVHGTAGLYRIILREPGNREVRYAGLVEAGRETRATLRPAPGTGKVPPVYSSLSPHVKPEQILDGELQAGKGPGEDAREQPAGASLPIACAAGWNLKMALDLTVPDGRPLAAVQVFAGRRRLVIEEIAPGSYRLEFETAGAEQAVVQFIPEPGRAEKVLVGEPREVLP